jgi:hypothetical protein
MISSQQVLAKHKKDVTRANELADEYQRKYLVCSSRLEELEDYITKVENDLDTQRIEWDAQQEQNDATLAQYETERDQIFNAAASIEVFQLLT